MSLVFKCVAPCAQTVFDAVDGESVVGHVCKELCQDGGFRWRWRLDVTNPATTAATSGFAGDREAAKRALADNWLAMVHLQEG